MPRYEVNLGENRVYLVDTKGPLSEEALVKHVQEFEKPTELPSEANPLSLAINPTKASESAPFFTAVERGLIQTGSLFTDVLPALGASLIGADDYAKRQMGEAAEKQEHIAKTLAPQIASYKDVSDIGDAGVYALETFGEQIPNLIGLLGGVGVAGAVTQQVAKKAIRKKVGERLKKFGDHARTPALNRLNRRAEKLVAETATKVAHKSHLPAAMLGSYALNAPEIFQNVYEETGEFAPATALLFGSVAAALDSVLPHAVVKALRGNPTLRQEVIKKAMERTGANTSVIRSLGAGVTKGMATEGVTESGQEAISILAERIVGENWEALTSTEFDRLIETAIRGAIVGAPLGGVSGAATGIHERREEKTDEQIDEDGIRIRELKGEIAALDEKIAARRNKHKDAKAGEINKESLDALNNDEAALSALVDERDYLRRFQGIRNKEKKALPFRVFKERKAKGREIDKQAQDAKNLKTLGDIVVLANLKDEVNKEIGTWERDRTRELENKIETETKRVAVLDLNTEEGKRGEENLKVWREELQTIEDGGALSRNTSIEGNSAHILGFLNSLLEDTQLKITNAQRDSLALIIDSHPLLGNKQPISKESEGVVDPDAAPVAAPDAGLGDVVDPDAAPDVAGPDVAAPDAGPVAGQAKLRETLEIEIAELQRKNEAEGLSREETDRYDIAVAAIRDLDAEVDEPTQADFNVADPDADPGDVDYGFGWAGELGGEYTGIRGTRVTAYDIDALEDIRRQIERWLDTQNKLSVDPENQEIILAKRDLEAINIVVERKKAAAAAQRDLDEAQSWERGGEYIPPIDASIEASISDDFFNTTPEQDEAIKREKLAAKELTKKRRNTARERDAKQDKGPTPQQEKLEAQRTEAEQIKLNAAEKQERDERDAARDADRQRHIEGMAIAGATTAGQKREIIRILEDENHGAYQNLYAAVKEVLGANYALDLLAADMYIAVVNNPNRIYRRNTPQEDAQINADIEAVRRNTPLIDEGAALKERILRHLDPKNDLFEEVRQLEGHLVDVKGVSNAKSEVIRALRNKLSFGSKDSDFGPPEGGVLSVDDIKKDMREYVEDRSRARARLELGESAWNALPTEAQRAEGKKRESFYKTNEMREWLASRIEEQKEAAKNYEFLQYSGSEKGSTFYGELTANELDVLQGKLARLAAEGANRRTEADAVQVQRDALKEAERTNTADINERVNELARTIENGRNSLNEVAEEEQGRITEVIEKAEDLLTQYKENLEELVAAKNRSATELVRKIDGILAGKNLEALGIKSKDVIATELFNTYVRTVDSANAAQRLYDNYRDNAAYRKRYEDAIKARNKADDELSNFIISPKNRKPVKEDIKKLEDRIEGLKDAGEYDVPPTEEEISRFKAELKATKLEIEKQLDTIYPDKKATPGDKAIEDLVLDDASITLQVRRKNLQIAEYNRLNAKKWINTTPLPLVDPENPVWQRLSEEQLLDDIQRRREEAGQSDLFSGEAVDQESKEYGNKTSEFYNKLELEPKNELDTRIRELKEQIDTPFASVQGQDLIKIITEREQQAEALASARSIPLERAKQLLRREVIERKIEKLQQEIDIEEAESTDLIPKKNPKKEQIKKLEESLIKLPNINSRVAAFKNTDRRSEEALKLENQLLRLRGALTRTYEDPNYLTESFLDGHRQRMDRIEIKKEIASQYSSQTALNDAADSIQEARSFDASAPESINNHTTVERIKNIIRARFGENALKRVNILEKPPEGLNIPSEYLGSAGLVIDGKDGKEIYLFTDRIQQGNELGVFMHEVGVHTGMKDFVGAGNYNFLVKKIRQFSKLDDGSLEEQIAKVAMQRVKKAQKIQPKLNESNELIAYFVEEAVRRGVDPEQESHQKSALGLFFKKIIASVKRTLRRFGFDVKTIDAQEIVDYAYGAARKVIRPLDAKTTVVDEQMMFNLASEEDSVIDALFGTANNIIKTMPPWTQEFANGFANRLSVVPDYIRKVHYNLLGIRQLADTVKRFNPDLANSLLDLDDVTARLQRRIDDRRIGYRNQLSKVQDLLAEAENELRADFPALSEEGIQERILEFYDAAHDSSIHQIDLRADVNGKIDFEKIKAQIQHEYRNVDGQKQREMSAKLAKAEELHTKFMASPVSLRKMYTEIVNSYEASLNELIDFYENVTGTVLTAEQKLNFGIITDVQGRIVPYLPLSRQGQYWLDALEEDITTKDVERHSYAFKSLREAEQFGDKLTLEGAEVLGKDPDSPDRTKRKGVFTRPSRDPKYSGDATGLITTMIQKLQEMKDPVDNEAYYDDEAILKLRELWFDALGSNNLRQQYKKREGIKGFERNMVENFAHMGLKYANELSTMEVRPRLDNTLAAIATLGNQKVSRAEDSVIQSVKYRTPFLRSPTPGRAWAMAAYGNYAFLLLGNISAAAVNFTQLPLVVFGLLGGEYGYDKAAKAITNGFKLYMNGGKDDNTRLISPITKRSLADRTLFTEENTKDDEGMKLLYEIALSKGAVRRTTSQELQDLKTGNVNSLSGVYARTELSMSWFFQNSERANREISLISAYNLAKESKNLDGSSRYTTRQAIEKAIVDVDRANGPALAQAGPAYFTDKLGKVIGTFKRFAFSQLYLQWQLARDAFGPEQYTNEDANLPIGSPTVKQLARKQLLATMVPAWIFAGTRGIPLYGVAETAIGMYSSIFGDDEDKPFDLVMRNIAGDLGYRGPLSHFLGLDFASRTGFYAMAFRQDPYRMAAVGPLSYAFESTLGPSYGVYFRNPQRALERLNEGQYYRALEAITPSFFRNPLKAARYAFNGAQTLGGDYLVENFSAYNIAGQFVGFSPEELARTYAENEHFSRMEREMNEEKSTILNIHYGAYITRDSSGMRDVTKRIAKFNQRRLVRRTGKEITPETIKRSVKSRENRPVVNGLTLPDADQYRLEAYG